MRIKLFCYLILLAICSLGIVNQIRFDVHRSIPEPVGIHLINSAIAISEIYGSGSGLAGNKAVLAALYGSESYNNFENCKRSGKGACVLIDLDLAGAREIAQNFTQNQIYIW